MRRKPFYLMLVICVIVLSTPVGTYSRLFRYKPRELSTVIEIRADEGVLHYKEESFWGRQDFSEILASKKEFESREVESFREGLERFRKGADNFKVKFDGLRRSTILMCDVKGTRYASDSYDFHWLLGDLPFDLYQFKQSGKELTWEGSLGHVHTVIRLTFPYSLAHCHEHVWPAR